MKIYKIFILFYLFILCKPEVDKSFLPYLFFFSNRTSNSAPSALNYTGNPYTFTINTAITSVNPTYSGTINSCTSSPTLPTGLTLGNTDCSITGTPTVSQSATNYTITASNSNGSTTATISITINSAAPSSLNYASNPYVFTLGVGITPVAPTFTGSLTSCTVTPALPLGLILNNTDCSISGTPTVNQAATNYTITASNSFGSTTAIISITINETAPSALSYAGNPFVFTNNVAITALNPIVTGTPTSYSVAPALPTGLSINTTTGVISGTPTTITASATYTVTATNSAGSTTFGIDITVNDAAPTALSYAGNPFVFTNNVAITALNPTITGTPTSYSVAPALPTGLSINTTTGVISGTPTAITASATYTVTATNSGGSTTFGVDITVNDVAPTALSYAGNPFTFTINNTITSVSPTVTGTPTSYSVTPALPTGLSINTTTGVLAGTPTITSALTIYTVTATNSGGSTNFNLSITVTITPPIRHYSFTSSSLLDQNSTNSLTGFNSPSVTVGKDADSNGAILFNGTNQYFTGPTTGFPTGSSPRTLCVWIKPTRLPPNPSDLYIITSYGATFVQQSFGLYLFNSLGTQQVAISGYGDDLIVNYTLPIHTWSHLCATYNGTTAGLYVNGLLIGSAGKSYATGSSYFVIGAQTGPTQYFPGKIDDFRLYDYVLTSAQMREVAAQIPNGLIAYYDFQGDTLDVSGYNKHLTTNTGTFTKNKNYLDNSAIKYTPGQSSSTFLDVTNLIDNFTITAWARWEDGLNFGNFVMNGTTNPYGLGFQTGGAFTRNIRFFGGGGFNYTTPQIPSGVWNHYILMREAGVWKVYMNGVLVFSNAGAIPGAVSGTFQVGGALNQSVDEVRVYNRILNAQEILTLSGYHPMQTVAWNTALGTSNLKLHLQADSLSNLSNNSAVTTWLDSSGNDFHVNQGAVPPVYNSLTGINGRPAVEFNAVNANLFTGCNTIFNGTQNAIFGAIYQTNTAGDFRGIFHHGKKLVYFNGGASQQLVLFSEVDMSAKVISPNNFIGLLTSSPTMIFSITHDGTSGLIEKNGTTQTLSSNVSGAYTCANQMTIGATFFESTGSIENSFYGQIGELIYLNASASITTRQRIHCYLSSKYNIPISHACP